METINASPNCDYCSDCFIYNSISAKFESYVKDFCDDIRTKAETIHTLFDEIIDIYITLGLPTSNKMSTCQVRFA